MEKNLNAADRVKLDEYLTSVREVEKTVKRRAYWAERPKPSMDYELEDFDRKSVDGYVGTLLDLAVLALQTDSTRAVTVQIPFWEGFKEPGLSGNYHDLSHHGQKKEKIEKLLKLEHAILKRINTSLNVMRECQVGNDSLLDQTTTLLTASMGSANSHNFDDLPALVVDNRMKNAGHWQKKDVPMSNLYLGLLQQFGGESDQFGESTGSFDLFVMRKFFVTAMMAIFFASGILQADPKLEKIFAQNCIKCHGPQKQKGKLRLDRPLGQIFSDRKLLENIAAVIEAEEMPPEEASQPTAEARAEALQIIQKIILAQRPDNPLKRLTRAEYTNTMHDLFGVDFDFTGLLPPDHVEQGFDKFGESHLMPPSGNGLPKDCTVCQAERVLPDAPPETRVWKFDARHFHGSKNFATGGGGDYRDGQDYVLTGFRPYRSNLHFRLIQKAMSNLLSHPLGDIGSK